MEDENLNSHAAAMTAVFIGEESLVIQCANIWR